MYGGMLSVHSTSRDQYGVPIVRNIVKVPMGSDSSEEKLAKKHWNEVHQSLRSKTADIRRLEERIEFFKNWSLRYLNPLRHTFIQVNSTIRSPKNTPLEDELAVLDQYLPPGDRSQLKPVIPADHCLHISMAARLGLF